MIEEISEVEKRKIVCYNATSLYGFAYNATSLYGFAYNATSLYGFALN